MDKKETVWYQNKLQYTRRFNKDNYKQYCIMVNKSTEASIISWLEAQSNKQGYIKQLILDDMKRRGQFRAKSR